MASHQKRMGLMLKDSVNKIIEDGIKPNLAQLNQCSKFLNSNSNLSKEKLWKESLNARTAIQHLRANLSQLEKAYLALKEIENFDYEPMILAIRDEASRDIETFQKMNHEMMKLNGGSILHCQSVADNLESGTYSLEQQQQHVLNEDELSLEEAKQRLQDVQTINRDLHDLQELICQFGSMVSQQQAQVDHIESNIETVTVNVHEGTKSLAKAASTSIVPIACAAVGASIFGPIGALVSFKISTGLISALGGSVASYGLASYLRNKKAKESQLELQNIVTPDANHS